ACKDAAGILAGGPAFTRNVIDKLPNCRVIVQCSVGVDQVDVEAATQAGIVVANLAQFCVLEVRTHTIALLLAVTKNVVGAAAALAGAAGGYYTTHRALELEGKTLGLVGFGRIARRVAQAAAGLGMKVTAYDPLVPAAEFFVDRASDLDELARQADVISIHVPLTPDTRHLFDRRRLRSMRPGSVLVNTSRGAVVDHGALLEVLQSGHLWGAALDVTDPEPLPPDHPLLHRSDVVITPHVASGTAEGRQRIFTTALAQVLAVLNGGRPDHLVNAEVWAQRRGKAYHR
ncbi:MAG TPA: C-terminal binding protein, partial [Acidimicrobiia bacterium]|nr:C-terminal binding protein [Acidimicrobiia bacterium]